MSYAFDGTGNFYLPRAPITDEPFTLACWAMHGPSGVGWQPLLGVFDYSGVVFSDIAVDASSNPAFAETYNGTNAASQYNGVSESEWHHIAGIFSSDTDRLCVVDGRWNEALTNTDSRAMTGSDRVGIGGAYWSSSVQDRLDDGFIAHAAIWSASLTPGEIRALALGANPLSIRREALTFYAPLLYNAVDVITGEQLTVEGTRPAFTAYHPQVDSEYESIHVPLIQVSDAWAAAASAALTASGTPTADQATATGAANASGVSITDVNTTESWNDGDTGLVITGGGFV